MSDAETGEKKYCGCCTQETLIKMINMGVAIAMIIVGVINCFKIGSMISAGTEILMYICFIVY